MNDTSYTLLIEWLTFQNNSEIIIANVS